MKKKRKSLWIMFVCLLVIIYLAGYYLLWMRTNPISYYSEKAKGNYNVSRVLHNARTGDARMSAMLGDKTYYYDYSDKKLRTVDSKSGKLRSALEDAGTYTNGKYIYVNSWDALRQYDADGKLVVERKLDADKRILQAFLGEKYIYIICGANEGDSYQQTLYVLDAADVRKTVDLGELKEKSGKGAFIDKDKHWAEHRKITTPDVNLYYIGSCQREKVKDGEVSYSLTIKDASKGYFFNPVMVNKQTGERVHQEESDLQDGKLLASYKDTLYAWDFWDESKDFCIYKTNADGKSEELYQSEKYKPVDMKVSGNMLMLQLEDYRFGGMEHYTGADYEAARYSGGELIYYDMEKQKIAAKYELKKEQAVLMSTDAYATFKDGKVSYYKTGQDTPFWTKKIKGYKTGKGDEIIRYDFQTYGDKLYVVYVDDESGENMRIMDVMELEK